MVYFDLLSFNYLTIRVVKNRNINVCHIVIWGKLICSSLNFLLFPWMFCVFVCHTLTPWLILCDVMFYKQLFVFHELILSVLAYFANKADCLWSWGCEGRTKEPPVCDRTLTHWYRPSGWWEKPKLILKIDRAWEDRWGYWMSLYWFDWSHLSAANCCWLTMS